MANRRMFSANEIQSDDFLELSYPAQVLYFNLAVSADDEGFLSRIKGIERLSGTSDKELQELIKSGFIIRFNSGVCVVANWHANNIIRKDRFHETTFKTERAQLITNDNQWYTKRKPHNNHMTTGGVLNEPNESKEPNELNEFNQGQSNSSTAIKHKDIISSSSANPQNSKSLVSEEVIRSTLMRNGNKVNSLVKEIIDSFGSNIDQSTMQLIEKVSHELKESEKK